MNPIFQQMNKQVNSAKSGNMNPLQMISEFAKFKKQMEGKDANAMLAELVNSGKFSKEQLQQAVDVASTIKGLLK